MCALTTVFAERDIFHLYGGTGLDFSSRTTDCYGGENLEDKKLYRVRIISYNTLLFREEGQAGS